MTNAISSSAIAIFVIILPILSMFWAVLPLTSVPSIARIPPIITIQARTPRRPFPSSSQLRLAIILTARPIISSDIARLMIVVLTPSITKPFLLKDIEDLEIFSTANDKANRMPAKTRIVRPPFTNSPTVQNLPRIRTAAASNTSALTSVMMPSMRVANASAFRSDLMPLPIALIPLPVSLMNLPVPLRTLLTPGATSTRNSLVPDSKSPMPARGFVTLDRDLRIEPAANAPPAPSPTPRMEPQSIPPTKSVSPPNSPERVSPTSGNILVIPEIRPAIINPPIAMKTTEGE